jgi:isopenicillin N synthase-like dioxygenase
MTTTAFRVPTVDIGPYLTAEAAPAARAATAAALDAACREVGFVQLVGHGVPDGAQDELAAALDEFFALPPEVKATSRRGPSENRGYTPPRTESLSGSLGLANQAKDFYEAYVVGTERTAFPHLELPAASYADNNWPVAAPRFRPAVERWFAEMQVVSRALLHACADALGLPAGWFDGMVDHSIDALKMNNYQLPEGGSDVAGELTAMGAHTDFGILTVLWADQVPGLQVLLPDGSWQDVQPDDGALLVNLGDAMARWTNDRWLSTVHRVAPPVVDGRIKRRRSAAFFFDGNHDAVIETLPGCATPDRPGYPPITVAENISVKVAGLKGTAAPSADLREAQRVLAAGR